MPEQTQKTMKQLILNIEKGRARLDLVSGGKILSSLEWKENNSLSRLLLSKIDQILRKNRVGLDPVPISLSKKGRLSLRRPMRVASHGAGHKDWAIRPTRRGKYPQQNWYGVDKISGFEIISDVPKKWTSVRIAEITFKTLELAR